MAHALKTQYLEKRIELVSLLCFLLLTACVPQTASPSQTTHNWTPGTALIAWPAFDGGGQRSGINYAENIITPANVANLVLLWKQTLPDIGDGAPAELPNVTTPNGFKNLLFVTTKSGSLLAIDADTGTLFWRKDTFGIKFTTSSPAIDAAGQFVYSYGVDGKVHKYAVVTGTETINGGWPASITLLPQSEKGSSPLNIANGFLYMTTSGYPGDAGHYEGHVVAVNLSTGSATVFNAICSNIHLLLDNKPKDPNYCPVVQGGIWGRGGAVIDPLTNNVFVTTGNGLFNANQNGHDYGDTVLELSPDLTQLIDSYTPSNYYILQHTDGDLGSSAPVILPMQSTSKTPYLAVQAGKDKMLRLLNRQNLSGAGGPNHIGGEIMSIKLPQGCDVDTHSVAWNDANNVTWVFVANSCGLSAFTVVTDNNGNTTLQLAYQNSNGGSSPFIANNILFIQDNGTLRAMDPTTGQMLWRTSVGPLHWQSPIVVNGHIYVVDNAGQISAYGFGSFVDIKRKNA